MGKLRGFTLVEMVVALTILSLIVLATITGMRTLAKTQQVLKQRTTQVARMRAVEGFVRKSIEQLQTVGYSSGAGTPTIIYFQGASHELVWAAPAPIPGVNGGLWAMRLTRNDDHQLMLQVREDISLTSWGEDTSISHVLAEDVEMFDITYRAFGTSDWRLEWPLDNPDGVPAYIKIQLKVGDRYWPELIVAITGWHNS